MQVLGRRVDRGAAVLAARDDDRHLEGQVDALLEHGRQRSEGGEGFLRLVARRDARLSLAVVSEATGLEDAGEERVGRRVEIGDRLDHRMRHDRDAARADEALLRDAVLRDGHAVGGRRGEAVLREEREALRGDVLEFRGDGRALQREMLERRRIEVIGLDMFVADRCRRSVARGVEHGDAITEALRRHREHASELPPAEEAEPVTGCDDPAFTRHRGRSSSRRESLATCVCCARHRASFAVSAGSPTASIATANSAAFTAPAAPIANVATGMPRGICTIEYSESRPWR